LTQKDNKKIQIAATPEDCEGVRKKKGLQKYQQSGHVGGGQRYAFYVCRRNTRGVHTGRGRSPGQCKTEKKRARKRRGKGERAIKKKMIETNQGGKKKDFPC